MNFKSTLATAAATLLFPVAVWATPMLSIVPSAANVATGGTFTADVVISGLQSVLPNQIVSSYLLDVTYNSGLLTQLGLATDQSGGAMGFDWTSVFGFDTSGTGLGNARAFNLNLGDPDATLLGLQGDGFTLFRVTFTAGVTDGAAFLSFGIPAGGGITSLTPDPLNGFAELLVYDTVGACVSIGAGTCRVVAGVPEPASYGLLAIGLLAAGAARFKRRRNGTATV